MIITKEKIDIFKEALSALIILNESMHTRSKTIDIYALYNELCDHEGDLEFEENKQS